MQFTWTAHVSHQSEPCRAEEAEPGHARTQHLRGYLRWRGGDLQAALADLTAAKAQIPDSPEVNASAPHVS